MSLSSMIRVSYDLDYQMTIERQELLLLEQHSGDLDMNLKCASDAEFSPCELRMRMKSKFGNNFL